MTRFHHGPWSIAWHLRHNRVSTTTLNELRLSLLPFVFDPARTYAVEHAMNAIRTAQIKEVH